MYLTTVSSLLWSALHPIVVVVLAVGLSVYVAMYWDRTWDVPEPDLHASTDPAVIVRGEYIVYGPAHCIVCHSGSLGATCMSRNDERRRHSSCIRARQT
jgi:hypothetical protein